MRISTNTLYQAGITRITQLQESQSRLMQQAATGRRLLTPADDPVASARALELQNAQNINARYGQNRMQAENQMQMVETNLAAVTELLISAKARLVGAGNASLDDQQRGFIAEELRNSLQSLIGLANEKDGSGDYLYSGHQTKTAPYLQTAAGADYQGDGGERLLQVSGGRQLAVTATGPDIFQANGEDVFAALQDIITLLDTPLATPADSAALTAGLATANSELQATLDNVLTVRARIGAGLNELEALGAAGDDRDIQYSAALSELQDLDYAKALSELSQQQTILQAAQKAFLGTTNLSLFNLL